MDVLGDNREEVIVCAWDGQTYIVDHDRNVVRYHFHKNVQVSSYIYLFEVCFYIHFLVQLILINVLLNHCKTVSGCYSMVGVRSTSGRLTFSFLCLHYHP